MRKLAAASPLPLALLVALALAACGADLDADADYQTTGAATTNEFIRMVIGESFLHNIDNYGCWCGNGPVYDKDNPPGTVDAIDACCQEHDFCWDAVKDSELKAEDGSACDCAVVEHDGDWISSPRGQCANACARCDKAAARCFKANEAHLRWNSSRSWSNFDDNPGPKCDYDYGMESTCRVRISERGQCSAGTKTKIKGLWYCLANNSQPPLDPNRGTTGAPLGMCHRPEWCHTFDGEPVPHDTLVPPDERRPRSRRAGGEFVEWQELPTTAGAECVWQDPHWDTTVTTPASFFAQYYKTITATKP